MKLNSSCLALNLPVSRSMGVVWVFWTSLIQVRKIHIYLPLPVLLCDQYNVRQPIWVVDLDNELGVFEFVYFCLYDFITLGFTVPFALDNWFGYWV